jgi:hypothetical protein
MLVAPTMLSLIVSQVFFFVMSSAERSPWSSTCVRNLGGRPRHKKKPFSVGMAASCAIHDVAGEEYYCHRPLHVSTICTISPL